MTLEAELEAACDLEVAAIADAIEAIGFECTRCGACCKGHEDDHTATVFPEEIRTIQENGYDWRDVARPMPFGLDGDANAGETFEWALQTDDCGDCRFYEEGETEHAGTCTVYDDRPLICQTYPFSIGELSETAEDAAPAEPMGAVVEREGHVRAHECEGLGRDISREEAVELAATLKTRAIRELEEAIGVREAYEPVDEEGVVVHDSEGQKRADGRPVSSDEHP